MSVSNQSIQPQAGEQYRPFVKRAHSALMQSIPDPDQRNEAVWSAWASAHGDPLRDRAQQLFPPDKYRLVPNVCYFCEHSTTSSDGTAVSYSVDSLGDIVDEHNERADTDNYTAITNGHTVRGHGVPDSIQPRVVGFAGPYRLGMIGYSKPKFAVFADEHQQRDELPTIDRKKRRSVEINRFRDGRRPYIDPVAILGAESPRLALPVARYQEDGAIVERYDVTSMISGSNTFIPRAEPIKDRHSTEPTNVDMNPNTSDQGAMIQNLVKALLATPEMQFVRSQMQAGQGGQPQPDPSQSQQPQPNPQGGPSEGQPDGVDQNGFGGGAGMGANPMANRYSAEHDNDAPLVERFSALHDEHAELSEKYSQLARVNEENMREYGRMREAVVALEKRAVDADRTMKIKDLYQQYPHFVELDSELDTCLYSHGSDMNSESFERHVERLESYAKRSSPTTQMLPGGRNESEATKEQYTEDFTQRVIDRYTVEANKGNVMTFPEAEALVRAELK